MTKEQFWDNMERISLTYKSVRGLGREADTDSLVEDYITDIQSLIDCYNSYNMDANTNMLQGQTYRKTGGEQLRGATDPVQFRYTT